MPEAGVTPGAADLKDGGPGEEALDVRDDAVEPLRVHEQGMLELHKDHGQNLRGQQRSPRPIPLGPQTIRDRDADKELDL